MYDYLIVGGGIAGLSALVKLSAEKKESSILLCEKDENCGGMIQTRVKNGFLLEKGPNAFMRTYDSVTKLNEMVKLGSAVIDNIPNRSARYIYKKDSIHKLPEGPIPFLKTELLTAGGKFRLLFEPFISRGPTEESVIDFATRRFGKEVALTFLDPMISGICAGDASKIDIKALFPKLGKIEEEYRSLLLFLMKYKKGTSKKSGKGRMFATLREGMGQLPDKIQATFKESIKTGTEVTAIKKGSSGEFVATVNGEEISCKKLIFATPSFVTAKLLTDINPELSKHLSEILYSDIITVNVGIKSSYVKHPLDGFGFLVPRNSGKRILGGMFLSGIFHGRAPEGKEIIKCYIGGSHDSAVLNLSDSEIEKIVVKELSDILGFTGAPDFIDIERILKAIPQYNIGHQARVRKINKLTASEENIQLIGNYFSGVSIDQAIKSGLEVF